MLSHSTGNESATLRHISCLSCESHTTVSFGPFGFLSRCPECGRKQDLDDMLEPVRSFTGRRLPWLRFFKRQSRHDDMLASA